MLCQQWIHGDGSHVDEPFPTWWGIKPDFDNVVKGALNELLIGAVLEVVGEMGGESVQQRGIPHGTNQPLHLQSSLSCPGCIGAADSRLGL